MSFPPSILDDIRARLPVSQVVGRRVALKKAGREWRGLSPFKVEKTPSFFVNDQKGFYHCFASGEHGDIFKFLMQIEGLTFPEAVEQLAQEAGVPLPKFEPRTPEAAARYRQVEDERSRLYALLDASQAFFVAQLRGTGGGVARRYLEEKRGLRRDTIDQFGLGYAPASRTALKSHLAAAGFRVDEMVQSGMLIGGPDIAEPYDRFRARVMFPIADGKGRIIAFGGRALEADVPAKYLNSPETPLFHKGSVLFNAARARPIAHAKGRVIVVEGYMDVVALAEAGFGEAVAPLGTALTEDQAQLLWRMADEPTLCFDGDSAGQKAAYRAIDTVLPHIKPGTSVRFAFLPSGLDPDDVIRQQGPAAMEDCLSRTRSLAEVLWDREWGTGDWSTPERRAQLERQLEILVARIADEGVRRQYSRDIRERLYKAWSSRRPTNPATPGKRFGDGRRTGPGGPTKGGWVPPRPSVSQSLRQSPLAALRNVSAIPPREAALALALLNHPWLIEQRFDEVAALCFTFAPLETLKLALLDLVGARPDAERTEAGDTGDNAAPPLDMDAVNTHLASIGLGHIASQVAQTVTHAADRFASTGTDPDIVAAGWDHAVAVHNRQVEMEGALRAAEAAYQTEQSEENFARIRELKALQTTRIEHES